MGAGGRVVGCSNYTFILNTFFKEWGERFNTKQHYLQLFVRDAQGVLITDYSIGQGMCLHKFLMHLHKLLRHR